MAAGELRMREYSYHEGVTTKHKNKNKTKEKLFGLEGKIKKKKWYHK